MHTSITGTTPAFGKIKSFIQTYVTEIYETATPGFIFATSQHLISVNGKIHHVKVTRIIQYEPQIAQSLAAKHDLIYKLQESRYSPIDGLTLKLNTTVIGKANS